MLTEPELLKAWRERKLVRVTNHDYEMEGYIAVVFNKLVDIPGDAPAPYGDVRCVVQDDRKFLVIQSGKNLEVVE